MPRGGTLKHVFAACRERYGVVFALSRHFLPRPGRRSALRRAHDGSRPRPRPPINDPTSPYRPHLRRRIARDPTIPISFGSHSRPTACAPFHDWHPADVLHFPVPHRSTSGRTRACGGRAVTSRSASTSGTRGKRGGAERRALPDARRRRRDTRARAAAAVSLAMRPPGFVDAARVQRAVCQMSADFEPERVRDLRRRRAFAKPTSSGSGARRLDGWVSRLE